VDVKDYHHFAQKLPHLGLDTSAIPLYLFSKSGFTPKLQALSKLDARLRLVGLNELMTAG
jgi:hypothetical protein